MKANKIISLRFWVRLYHHLPLSLGYLLLSFLRLLILYYLVHTKECDKNFNCNVI